MTKYAELDDPFAPLPYVGWWIKINDTPELLLDSLFKDRNIKKNDIAWFNGEIPENSKNNWFQLTPEIINEIKGLNRV